MFQKRYSPIVLTKTTMFALHLAEQRIRFVLKDEMIRFLHLTIDDSKWEKEGLLGGDSHSFHRSDISASVLCRNGKVIDVEVDIKFIKCLDGTWVISANATDGDGLRFLNCKHLKGTRVYFYSNTETGAISQFYVWEMNVDAKRGTSPDDEALQEVRQKLLAE